MYNLRYIIQQLDGEENIRVQTEAQVPIISWIPKLWRSQEENLFSRVRLHPVKHGTSLTIVNWKEQEVGGLIKHKQHHQHHHTHTHTETPYTTKTPNYNTQALKFRGLHNSIYRVLAPLKSREYTSQCIRTHNRLWSQNIMKREKIQKTSDIRRKKNTT